MSNRLTITVNGKTHPVTALPDTPLLYILRNELGLNSPQFGCASEQCGACTVLLGRRVVKSCKMTVAEATGGMITTLEGLAEDGTLHPIQRAFVEEQAAQCGYCSNGMILQTAALLWSNPHPTDEQIRAALDGNLCRCGVHLRILRAVKRAAEFMTQVGA